MKQRAALAVILAATMAGSSGVFVKHMEMPVTSMGFFRSLLPVLLMGGIMRYQRIPFFRGNYRLMTGISVLNVLRMYLFFTAYTYTSMGNAILISYTWPIFVNIFSAIFLKEIISRRNIILLVLAFLGIVIVSMNQPFSFENHDFIGMAAALGMALVYALTVVGFKKESHFYSPTEIIFYQNFAGVFLFLPFLFINPWPTNMDLMVSAGHSFFLGTIGFSFFFFGLRSLSASTASGLAYIEIVSALLFGIFVMNEPFTWNMAAGGALIILSTALLKR